MTGEPPRRVAAAFAAACAVASLLPCLLAGCGDQPAQPRKRRVQDLDVPTDAAREAGDKLHDAEVFFQAGKSKVAEPLLRRVLELRPDDRRAAELLARCLIDRGRHREAVPLLERALEGNVRNNALHGLLVQVQLQLQDFPAAERSSRAWTEADAQCVDAWFNLGRALYRLDRYEDAIQAFRRAEGLKASRADVRSEMGLALAAAGRLPLAEAKYRDAIDRQPDYADAWFRLGDVIFRRDPTRFREAVQAMERAVEIEPSMVVGHLYLFRVCRLARVPENDPVRARGEQAWKAVLRIHGRAQLAPVLGPDPAEEGVTSEFALREQAGLRPDDPAPRVAVGRFLQEERRFDEAAQSYRKALELGATDARTHLLLAAALVSEVQGRAPGAKGAATPPPPDPARAEALLREAEEQCRSVLAGAPEDSGTNRLLAWVLLLQGRDADAEAAAEKAIAGAPDDVLAKKLRALARMHEGRLDEGLQEIAALGWL